MPSFDLDTSSLAGVLDLAAVPFSCVPRRRRCHRVGPWATMLSSEPWRTNAQHFQSDDAPYCGSAVGRCAPGRNADSATYVTDRAIKAPVSVRSQSRVIIVVGFRRQSCWIRQRGTGLRTVRRRCQARVAAIQETPSRPDLTCNLRFGTGL